MRKVRSLQLSAGCRVEAEARRPVREERLGGGAQRASVDHAELLVEDGDEITIDAEADTINVALSHDEFELRRAAWRQPEPRYRRGVLAKYARTVSSASLGAVTDLPE